MSARFDNERIETCLGSADNEMYSGAAGPICAKRVFFFYILFYVPAGHIYCWLVGVFPFPVASPSE